ncbi:PilW family protein [Ferrimonas balearica]|uniref:PilW family protein n=1 Tax=Ferrimonas balearica TaxID=44012 RepID=UPI001C573B8B|nr:PilW family protein [Ferrimonas balearica]MBW3140803.1 PilW family protein [Ferrimonas balearica]MBY6107393.1 PilW family protein [Ferrimonas balearica]
MNQQRGLTLPELMVAMVIGLFITGASLSVFVMSSSSVQSTGQYNQLQESARLALRLMEEDIAQAGFFADLTGVDLIGGANVTVPGSIVGTDCVGDGLNNGTFPNGMGHFRTLWAFTKGSGGSLTCENGALSGSDVIQIKRLVGPEVVGSTASGRYYMTLNVNEGQFFDGAGTPPTLTSGRVYQYQHRVYYVRNNVGGIPSLYRHTLSTTDMLAGPQSLVEGIESMQFEFGVDFDEDSTVDSYLTSSQVTDDIWDSRNDVRILAVRVHLLLRALESDSSYDTGDTVQYRMPNGTIRAGDDGFRRKRVSTTIMLNNPLLISHRSAE